MAVTEAPDMTRKAKVRSRLFSLRCLAQEVMADSEVSTTNMEIMEALSRLNDTLQPHGESSHLPASRKEAPRTRETGYPVPNLGGSEPLLPILPPILDN